ncbi:hypothetical protein D3C80_1738620 [compost metagenome]
MPPVAGRVKVGKVPAQKIKHDPFVDTQLAQRIDAGTTLYLDVAPRFLILNQPRAIIGKL